MSAEARRAAIVKAEADAVAIEEARDMRECARAAASSVALVMGKDAGPHVSGGADTCWLEGPCRREGA